MEGQLYRCCVCPQQRTPAITVFWAPGVWNWQADSYREVTRRPAISHFFSYTLPKGWTYVSLLVKMHSFPSLNVRTKHSSNQVFEDYKITFHQSCHELGYKPGKDKRENTLSLLNILLRGGLIQDNFFFCNRFLDPLDSWIP